MMTLRTNKEYSTKWRQRAGMYMVACSMGLNPSTPKNFAGRLEHLESINTRQARQ